MIEFFTLYYIIPPQEGVLIEMWDFQLAIDDLVRIYSATNQKREP